MPKAVAPSVISSLTNPQVKALRALHDRKGRKAGLFLAEGLKIILTALEAGWPLAQLVVQAGQEQNKHIQKIMAALPPAQQPLWVTAGVMEKISARDNPQTVIATFKQQWQPLPNTPNGLWLVLEGIKDPGNLGTIIRTADAAGVAGIILVGETCDPYSLEAVRASMGSIFAVRLTKVPLAELVRWHGQHALPLFGTHLAATRDYRAIQRPAGAALLAMGSEQQGLSGTLAEACTDLLKIPMQGRADSLNVAIATAIVLFNWAPPPSSFTLPENSGIPAKQISA